MSPSRPPFDMSRAVFWLIAFVVAASIVGSVVGGVVCIIVNYGDKILECRKLELRDFVGELLAVVLLLLNHRREPPPPK